MNEALRALARAASRSGIFTDFDGTLSEIVEHHEAARAVDGAAEVLAALAERFGVVAVVSGRDLDDLRARLSPPGVRLLGSYGLEELRDGLIWTHPDAERQRRKIEDAIEVLSATVPDGVRVERKGLSVAVHFRPAADPSSAQEEVEPIVRQIADAELLEVVRGRFVLELRPRVAIDKGVTVRRLISEHFLHGALVVGDDLGDVVMFDAISSVEHPVRVGVQSPEMPAELRARADLTVAGPAEVVGLLRSLASA